LMTNGPSANLRARLQARNESGVSVQTAGRDFTNLGIVVREVGHFCILRRRTDEAVASGRQRLFKPAILLLGQHPATIKKLPPLSRRKPLECEFDFPGRQCLRIEEQTVEAQRLRNVIFRLKDRLR